MGPILNVPEEKKKEESMPERMNLTDSSSSSPPKKQDIETKSTETISSLSSIEKEEIQNQDEVEVKHQQSVTQEGKEEKAKESQKKEENKQEDDKSFKSEQSKEEETFSGTTTTENGKESTLTRALRCLKQDYRYGMKKHLNNPWSDDEEEAEMKEELRLVEEMKGHEKRSRGTVKKRRGECSRTRTTNAFHGGIGRGIFSGVNEWQGNKTEWGSAVMRRGPANGLKRNNNSISRPGENDGFTPIEQKVAKKRSDSFHREPLLRTPIHSGFARPPLTLPPSPPLLPPLPPIPPPLPSLPPVSPPPLPSLPLVLPPPPLPPLPPIPPPFRNDIPPPPPPFIKGIPPPPPTTPLPQPQLFQETMETEEPKAVINRWPSYEQTVAENKTNEITEAYQRGMEDGKKMHQEMVKSFMAFSMEKVAGAPVFQPGNQVHFGLQKRLDRTYQNQEREAPKSANQASTSKETETSALSPNSRIAAIKFPTQILSHGFQGGFTLQAPRYPRCVGWCPIRGGRGGRCYCPNCKRDYRAYQRQQGRDRTEQAVDWEFNRVRRVVSPVTILNSPPGNH